MTEECPHNAELLTEDLPSSQDVSSNPIPDHKIMAKVQFPITQFTESTTLKVVLALLRLLCLGSGQRFGFHPHFSPA